MASLVQIFVGLAVLLISQTLCDNSPDANGGNNSQRTVNLLWPGSSFASIACGSQYQLLAQQNYKIQNILGASGGATSAILMLSDPNPTSLTVLRNIYTTYGPKCYFDTECWKGVYQNLLENHDGTTPGAFERVKQFGKVSLVCDGKPYVLHNFLDEEQAAQAYAASGGGPIQVKHVGEKCEDGGLVKQSFPDSMKTDSLAYFATTAPQEGSWSFPVFCPQFPPYVIVLAGYQCMDYLTTIDRIHPETYTSFDSGIPGRSVWYGVSTWKDCTSGRESQVMPKEEEAQLDLESLHEQDNLVVYNVAMFALWVAGFVTALTAGATVVYRKFCAQHQEESMYITMRFLRLD